MKQFFKKVAVVSVVAMVLLMSFAVLPAAASEKNPVVLVHGYLDNTSEFGRSNFGALKDYLISQGWSDVRILQYSNPTGSNIPNANELKAFVDNVLLETGSEKVDIVAHSMGGLSSRYYIKNLQGVDKVGALVTLGTPHYGTNTALTVSLTGGGREMIPGSRFLNDLNSGDLTPGNIHYSSVYTYSDQVVPWWKSPVDGWNNKGGWYDLHISMLNHDSVHKLVQDNLSQ